VATSSPSGTVIFAPAAPDVSTAGVKTYTANITVNGCAATQVSGTYTVLEAVVPTFTIDKNEVCPGGTINITPPSVSGTVTWASTGGTILGTVLTATSTPGAYTITATNTETSGAKSCQNQHTENFTVRTLPTVTVAVSNQNTQCFLDDLTVTPTVTGAGATVTWYKGTVGTALGTGASQSGNNLLITANHWANGDVYIAAVTDGTCPGTDASITLKGDVCTSTLTLGNPTVCYDFSGDIQIPITALTPLNNSITTVSISPTIGSTSNFTVTGGNIVIPSSVFGATSTSLRTFVVTATSATGDNANSTVTFSVQPPAPTFGTINAVCKGTNAVLNVVGGSGTYHFTPVSTPHGFTAFSGTTASPTVSTSGLDAGTYTFNVYYVDAAGCTSATSTTESFVVNGIPAQLTLGVTPMCVGGTTDITIGNHENGATFIWSGFTNAGPTAVDGQTSYTFAPGNAAGTYTITVRQSKNTCDGADVSATLTVHGVPGKGTIGGTQTICENTQPTSNLTFTPDNSNAGNQATSFEWYTTPNNATTWVTSPVTPSTIGNMTATTTYFVRVQYPFCGPIDSDPVTITVTPAPVLNDITTDEVCAGGNITFTAVPNIGTLSVFRASDNSPITSTTGLAAGTYGFYGYVVSGCQSNTVTGKQFTIKPNSTPITISLDPTTPVCSGATVTIDLSRELESFETVSSWSGIISSATSTADPKKYTFAAPTSGGTVTLTVGTTNSCTGISATSGTLTVIQAATAGSIAASGVTTICENTAAPSLTVTPNAPANNPYTIQWQTDVSGSFQTIAGQTGATLNPGILTTTQTFRAVITYACNAQIVNVDQQITVTPAPVLAAGNITAAPVCTTQNMSFSSSVPGTLKVFWDAALTNEITSTTTTAAGTHNFWAHVTNTTSGCQSNTVQGTFTIKPYATPVTLSLDKTHYCIGETAEITARNQVTGETWTWAVNGGVSPLPTETTSPYTFKTTASSTTVGLTVTLDGCPTENTIPAATFTVRQAPAAGGITTAATAVCEGTAAPQLTANPATATNNATTGVYRWEYKLSSATDWTHAGVATATYTHPANLTAAMDFRVMVYYECDSAMSNIQTITVTSAPNLPTVAPNPVEICQGTTSVDVIVSGFGDGARAYFTHSLLGVTIPTGAQLNNGSVTISGTNNLAVGNHTFTVHTQLTAASACQSIGTTTGTITVRANPANLEVTGVDVVCAGSSANITVTGTVESTDFVWSVVGGSTPTGTASPFTFTASSAGTLGVRQVVNHGGTPALRCTSDVQTTLYPFTVEEQATLPTLTATAASVCPGSVPPTIGYTGGANFSRVKQFRLSGNGVNLTNSDLGVLILAFNTANTTVLTSATTYTLTFEYNDCAPQSTTVTVGMADRPTGLTLTPTPANATVCVGQPITVKADATGTGTIDVDFKVRTGTGITFSPTTVSNGGSTTIQTTGWDPTQTYQIYAVAKNTGTTCEFEATSNLTLVVNVQPTVSPITYTPACMYQNVTLNTTITPSTDVTIKWYLTSDVGQTELSNTNSYTITTPPDWASGVDYTVVATHIDGCSATGSVSVVPATTGCNYEIEANISSPICEDALTGNITLTVTATDSRALTSVSLVNSHGTTELVGKPDFNEIGVWVGGITGTFTIPASYFTTGNNTITVANNQATADPIVLVVNPTPSHPTFTVPAICQGSATTGISTTTATLNVRSTAIDAILGGTFAGGNLSAGNALTSGFYVIEAQQAVNGCWSAWGTAATLEVKAIPQPLTLTLTSANPICGTTGATVEGGLNKNLSDYSNIVWTLGGVTGTSPTTGTNWNFTISGGGYTNGSKTVTVQVSADSVGCPTGSSNPITVVVNQNTTTAPAISGLSELCSGGDMDNLSITGAEVPNANARYIWYQNGSAISGEFSTKADANTWFGAYTGKSGLPDGTTNFSAKVTYGACQTAGIESNIIGIVVHPQVTNTLALQDPPSATHGHASQFSGHHFELSGLANANTVEWFYCFNAGATKACDGIFGTSFHQESGVTGATASALMTELPLSVGFYSVVAEASRVLTTPALNDNCIAQKSNVVEIEVEPGGITLPPGWFEVIPASICETDLTVDVTIAQGGGSNFDKITLYHVATAPPSDWTGILEYGNHTFTDADGPEDYTFTIGPPLALGTHSIRVCAERTTESWTPFCQVKTFTVSANPTIASLSPASATVCSTENFTGSITANLNTSIPTATYKWFRDNVEITGATTNTLSSVNNITAPTIIRVEVINGACTIPTTQNMTIDIYNTPTGVSLLASGTAECSDATNVTLTATATGDNLSYVWYRSLNATTWTEFGGTAATQVVQFPTSATANVTEHYKVVVRNHNCESTKDSADVSVNWTYKFTQTELNAMLTLNPNTASACEGLVEATYSGSLTLQSWKLEEGSSDVTPVTWGATNTVSPTLTLTSGPATFTFTAALDNGTCGTQNAVAAINITAGTKATTITATQQDVCFDKTNQTVLATVDANHSGVVAWQISPDGTNFANFSTGTGGISSLTANPATAGVATTGTNRFREPVTGMDSTFYVRARFEVAGCGTELFSNVVLVTVHARPLLTGLAMGDHQDICITETTIKGGVKTQPSTVKGTWAWEVQAPSGSWTTTGIGVDPLSTQTPVADFIYTPSGSLVAGVYKFRLVATTDGACDPLVTSEMDVTVWNTVTAGTIRPSDTLVCAGGDVTFTIDPANNHVLNGISTANVSYAWTVNPTRPVSSPSLTGATVTFPYDALGYTVRLEIWNAGCTSRSSSAATVKTMPTTGMATPTLTPIADTICVGGDFNLIVDNLDIEATHLRIYNGATVYRDNILITSRPMSVTITSPSAGTYTFAAQAFIQGMGGSCSESARSTAGTFRVNLPTSTTAGIEWLVNANPSPTLQEVKIGLPTGGITFSTGVPTLPSSSISNIIFGGTYQMYDDSDVAMGSPVTMSGWSAAGHAGISTNDVSAAAYVMFTATVQNAKCSVETTAPIRLDLLEGDEVNISGLTPICQGSTATLTLSGEALNDVTAGSWFRVNPADLREPIKAFIVGDLTAGNLTFSEQLNVEGTYLYIFRYQAPTVNSGAWTEDTATIVVDATTNIGTVAPSTSSICATNPAGVELNLSTTNGEVKGWQFSANNTFGDLTTFNAAGTGTNNDFTWTTTTHVADSGYYRVIVQNGVCAPMASTPAAFVAIFSAPNAGVITPNNAEICEVSTETLTVAVVNGTVQRWLFSTNKENWSTISGATGVTHTAADSGWYRVIVENGASCTPDTTDAVLLKVWSQTVPGTATPSSTDPVCQGEALTLTANPTIGTVTGWEYSTDWNGTAGTWTPVATPNQGTASGNVFTVNTNVPANKGFYRAIVKNGACAPKETNAVDVEIIPTGFNGTIQADGQNPVLMIYFGDDFTLTLGGDALSEDMTWEVSYNERVTWDSMTVSQTAKTHTVLSADFPGRAWYHAITVASQGSTCESITDWVEVRSYDKLEWDTLSPALLISSGGTITVKGVAAGSEREQTDDIFVTIPENEITYVWYVCEADGATNCEPITVGGTFDGKPHGITFSTDRTEITVPDAWYIDNPDVAYKVVATWTNNAHIEELPYEFKIRYDEEMRIVLEDPGYIPTEETVTLTTTNFGYQGVHEWHWIDKDGVEHLLESTKTTVTETPDWFVNATDNSISIIGDVDLHGTQLRLTICEQAVPTKCVDSLFEIKIVKFPKEIKINDATVCVHSDVPFAMKVTDTDADTAFLDWNNFTVEWQRNPATTATMLGEHAHTLNVANAGTAPNVDGTVYTVVLAYTGPTLHTGLNPSNYMPTVIPGTLTVVDSFDFEQPVDAFVCLGSTAQFSTTVYAPNNAAYTIQWFNDKNEVVGSGLSLSTPALTEAENYRFVISNDYCGSKTSNVVKAVAEGITNLNVTRTVEGEVFNNGAICYEGLGSKEVVYTANVSTMVGTTSAIDYNWNGTGWTTFNTFTGYIPSTLNEGDVVTLQVRLRDGARICPFSGEYTNTIEIQNPSDLAINIDGEVECGVRKEFGFTASMGGATTWYLGAMIDDNIQWVQPEWFPFLSPGSHLISVRVVQPGCTATAATTVVIPDNMDLTIESLFVDGTRTGNKIVLNEPGQTVDLNMLIADQSSRTGLTFEWTILDEDTETGYPIATNSTLQNITTAEFDETFQTNGWTQIIRAVVKEDATGCESTDTINITVGRKFELEMVDVTARRMKPDGTGVDLYDTVTTDRNPILTDRFVDEFTICHDQIIYFTPHVSEGAIGPFKITWTSNIATELYINDERSYATMPITMNETDDYPLGFRVNAALGTPIIFTVTVTNASGSTVQGEILVHVRKSPYMNVRVEPTMFGNAYYENQIINFVADPIGRFDSIEFYRFIGDYYGVFDVFEDGKPQPFVTENPVLITRIPEGSVKGKENRQVQVVAIGRDEYGCYAEDTVTIKLVPVPSVLIPDDPYNELNRVLFPDFDIEVFDTWGLKVQGFGTKGWNAKYNGRIVRSGTYYYNVRIPTPRGFEVMSGAITVIRDREFDH
jgi:hypothetical protein